MDSNALLRATRFAMHHALTSLRDRQDEFCGNRSHLCRLIEALENEAPEAWNEWRKRYPEVRPDLRGANLGGAILGEINLERARLVGARLNNIRAWQARLASADLRHAAIQLADLNYADLRGANLQLSRLVAANLTLAAADGASFRGANL